MPRNTRNFWFTARVDGRTAIEAGPSAKDGGFDIEVKQRDNGSIADGVVRVVGRHIDGKNVITVLDESGAEVYRRETVR